MSIQERGELSINGASAPKSDESALSYDERFQLLSNSRRRAAIHVLFQHERIDFGDLVDRVAEIEYGLPIDEISSDERHTIYVSLQQTHAKRLERDGIIDRDRDTGSIALGPNAEELVPHMEKLYESESFGSKLKRSLSALC